MLRQSSWKILGGLHSGVEARMVHLPRTLLGRLYLLSPLFTVALHAAMLTDPYLTGYVTDEDDWAYVSDAARPDDPVLAAACDHITARARQRLREMT
jgi:hypothetical protein